jgi:hypothetical protein
LVLYLPSQRGSNRKLRGFKSSEMLSTERAGRRQTMMGRMRQYAFSLVLLSGHAWIVAPACLAQQATPPRQQEQSASSALAGNGFSVALPDGFETAHQAYLTDGTLQLERPQQQMESLEQPLRAPPGWLRSIAMFLESLGPLFRALFYVVLAGVVLALLWFVFGEAIRIRLGWTREKTIDGKKVIDLEYRPETSRARSLLEEADQLAADGRFAEAVHLLLFRSIEDLQARVSGGVPDSFTAREIAGLKQMPDAMRNALMPIIWVVERSFFGGRMVDQKSWEEARRSYEYFAFGSY